MILNRADCKCTKIEIHQMYYISLVYFCHIVWCIFVRWFGIFLVSLFGDFCQIVWCIFVSLFSYFSQFVWCIFVILSGIFLSYCLVYFCQIVCCIFVSLFGVFWCFMVLKYQHFFQHKIFLKDKRIRY